MSNKVICLGYVLVLCFTNLLASEDVGQKRNVVDYNADTFEKEEPWKPRLILFYAPWCGHCKRLKPVWDELAEKNNKESGVVTIGKVDCTVHTSVCAAQGVNGYPTFKFFAKGTENGVKYKAARDLRSFEIFIAEQLGLEIEGQEEVPEAVSGMVEFTDTTFQEAIKSGSYFVMFYAPWCGHCKRMEPTWSSLAKSFEYDTSVIIGRFDCTKYRPLCDEFEVKGYPTLLWIENGKKVAKYSGSRTYEDLKRFVVEQLGEWIEAVEETTHNGGPPQTVVTLTAENFENAIAQGATFIMFFAPWCGHCKRIAPIYAELGGKFLGVEGVTIAKMDCTTKLNTQLCAEQKITGFPTFVLYKDGKRDEQFDERPVLDKMAEFITTNIIRDEL